MISITEAMVAHENCWVQQHGQHLCGYVEFQPGAVPDAWRGNYNAPGLQLLAIHGGLTYAEELTFGFDCNHAGDKANELLQSPTHVFSLTLQMRQQMIALAARWPEFMAEDKAGKAKILDEIRDQAVIPTEYGLGGMIEILCGAPSLD